MEPTYIRSNYKLTKGRFKNNVAKHIEAIAVDTVEDDDDKFLKSKVI